MDFTLYPAVDIRGGRAVRLTRGDLRDETVYDADPVAAARRWQAAGAQWLHVVDLDAAFTGEPRNRAVIGAIVDATGLPVQASGGVRSADDLAELFALGAHRVVVGTMALVPSETGPSFIEEAIAAYGDRIAIGLDVRGTTLQARGWTQEAGELAPTLDRLRAAGCARYVCTDVGRDGTLDGPNRTLLRDVADATATPVTASGGVGSIDDLRALASCHPLVDGAIVGRALYAGRFTLEEALAVTS